MTKITISVSDKDKAPKEARWEPLTSIGGSLIGYVKKDPKTKKTLEVKNVPHPTSTRRSTRR